MPWYDVIEPIPPLFQILLKSGNILLQLTVNWTFWTDYYKEPILSQWSVIKPWSLNETSKYIRTMWLIENLLNWYDILSLLQTLLQIQIAHSRRWILMKFSTAEKCFKFQFLTEKCFNFLLIFNAKKNNFSMNKS